MYDSQTPFHYIYALRFMQVLRCNRAAASVPSGSSAIQGFKGIIGSDRTTERNQEQHDETDLRLQKLSRSPEIAPFVRKRYVF